VSEIDQQFIEYVVKSLVGKPDAVHIDRRIDEKGVLLELTVDPEDLGRVIGKRGATAQSLRTLLRALGTKNDARYNLKIIDNGTQGPRSDDSQSPSDGGDSTTSVTSTDDDSNTTAAVEPEEPSTEEQPSSEEHKHEDETSDRLRQTREELADLDDLDV
jgi:predicted RNA-binding protein YlqC (UPF0109 family)